MTSKVCFKCKAEKPFEAFYKHAAMGDGRLGKCKECTKSDVLTHRQVNLENIRAYDRMRASMPHRVVARSTYAKTEAGKASAIRAHKKSELKHPERKKASEMVNNAIRDGRLHRQPCWVCGLKAQGHHPDYSRPLDVVWLCSPHHKQAHALI